MVKDSDILKLLPNISDVSEQDYADLGAMLETLDIISSEIPQYVYVVDYFKRNIMYASYNPISSLGYTFDEFKRIGYTLHLSHMTDEEFQLLVKIRVAISSFFRQRPQVDRLKYSISTNFKIKEGIKDILMNYKRTPLKLDKNGNIWLELYIVSTTSCVEHGSLGIRKRNSSESWVYEFGFNEWIQRDVPELNDREKEIVYLSAQGYTMLDISNKLHISLDTVKFHKKKLFEHLSVKNMAEAITFTNNHKLI